MIADEDRSCYNDEKINERSEPDETRERGDLDGLVSAVLSVIMEPVSAPGADPPSGHYGREIRSQGKARTLRTRRGNPPRIHDPAARTGLGIDTGMFAELVELLKTGHGHGPCDARDRAADRPVQEKRSQNH